MFLRTVKTSDGKGSFYEYVRLVESVRVGSKLKQRVVCNLGRKELLAEHLDGLIRLLRGEAAVGKQRFEDAAGRAEAWDWGPMLVGMTLWRELGLEAIIDGLSGCGRSNGVALSDRALVLVANRLCAPSSEHGLARWLETDFVCDRLGRRFVPEWRDEQERKQSALPRVRVKLQQLKQWYRTLDQMLARKEQIEKELYLRLRDLFSLKVDLVFYDLTSTYFEGSGPPAMGAHGHSRDGKPRKRQVLVGVVMVGGWPIAHHVFRGNMKDAQTVPTILDDIESRFGIERVVFVGDRGMVTSGNIAQLRAREQGYVVGLQRRRRAEVQRYVEAAMGPWIECPVGIAAGSKSDPPRTQVQEVPGPDEGVRVFVVHSDERLAYERGERLKAMARVRLELEALRKRIKQGRLKDPARIGAAAGRVLGRNHGHRYYDWEYKNGRFRYFEHPVNLKREMAHEGKYLIQTEEKDLSPLDAVRVYKELNEVERGFRSLKDVLEMRPIWHQTDERVEAHIFIATLALLLHRALERKLKTAGSDLSATEALQLLKTVHVLESRNPDGTILRRATRGSERADAVLSAVGITECDPPSSLTTSVDAL
jgi:transposase